MTDNSQVVLMSATAALGLCNILIGVVLRFFNAKLEKLDAAIANSAPKGDVEKLETAVSLAMPRAEIMGMFEQMREDRFAMHAENLKRFEELGKKIDDNGAAVLREKVRNLEDNYQRLRSMLPKTLQRRL